MQPSLGLNQCASWKYPRSWPQCHRVDESMARWQVFLDTQEILMKQGNFDTSGTTCTIVCCRLSCTMLHWWLDRLYRLQNLDLGQVSRQKVGQAHDSTCSLDAKSPWQPRSATLKLRQTSSVKACTFNFIEFLLIFLNHFESFSARWWISGGRQPKRARQKEGWIFTLGELGVDNRS